MSIRTSLNGGDREFLLQYMKQDAVAAEIGVWRGEFSSAVLAATLPSQYHLIDAWIAYPNAAGVLKHSDVEVGAEEKRYKEVLQRFSTEISEGKIVIHRKLSVPASDDFVDDMFDWIYVDGGHTYEDVHNDLTAYFSKVKIGGYIMGDDYNPNAWKGVVRAVDEFRTKSEIETISLNNCQFVLRRVS